MINPSATLPAPVVITHNPLARQPEEEETERLKAQPLPPVEELSEDARLQGRGNKKTSESEQSTPGSLIDSYV